MNPSAFFTFTSNDAYRGIINAVVAATALAVLTVLQGVVQQAGFDVFTADWGAIAKSAVNNAVNAAFVTLVGYLGTKALTTKSGNVAGVVKY